MSPEKMSTETLYGEFRFRQTLMPFGPSLSQTTCISVWALPPAPLLIDCSYCCLQLLLEHVAGSYVNILLHESKHIASRR